MNRHRGNRKPGKAKPRANSIDTRYLKGVYARRFATIATSIIQAYHTVLDQIHTKFELEYDPTVYVIPYVIQRDIGVPGTTRSYRATYFNLTTLDACDPRKLSIYSSIEFLEKFPKFISAGLGHEVAHIIAEKDHLRERVNIDASLFHDPSFVEQEKEVRKDEIVELFPKPLRNRIDEWDALSRQWETKEYLCRDAWIVEFGVFLSIAFDDKFEDQVKSLVGGSGLDVGMSMVNRWNSGIDSY